jgi:hypothetical protein
VYLVVIQFGGYTGCLDGEFTDMSLFVSSSDSDDSLKGGNVINPPSSTWFLQYKVILQHVGDEALQLYLENRPTTVVNQSKFLHDRKKKYSYCSCVCGCSYCLVIIFSVDEPSTIESRETAIPSNHDMALSQAITCHHPMDREVRDTIVQLLEQNRFKSKIWFPIIIRASLISTMRYVLFRISCGCPFMLAMRHLTRHLFLSMM